MRLAGQRLRRRKHLAHKTINASLRDPALTAASHADRQRVGDSGTYFSEPLSKQTLIAVNLFVS